MSFISFTFLKSRRIRYAARMGELRNAYVTVVGKYKRKRALGDRGGRTDNIKMGTREIGCRLDLSGSDSLSYQASVITVTKH
jgi:hypothetical protein